MKKLILFLCLLSGCQSTITSGTVIYKSIALDINHQSYYFITIGKIIDSADKPYESTRKILVDKKTYDKYEIGDYFTRYPKRAEKE